jgi:hypothetical protein
MIKRDRELLARLAGVNRLIGQVTVGMLTELPCNGSLPADRLRVLSMHLHEIGDDLGCRAAEIDGHVIDGSATVVIDVRGHARELPAVAAESDYRG